MIYEPNLYILQV